MATPVIMPRQGQSVESCIITKWNKQVGDSVAVGDILFSYETDKAAFDEEAKEAVIKKFETVVTANNGTVDQVDKWGTKKYAYPIDYKNEGYYVLMTFAGEPSLPRELERQMGISDEIVRYMVIRK